MTDAEIAAFAARLEAEVRGEDVRLMTDMRKNIEDKGAGTILTANRAAFLHLAALTLRGAIATENVISDRIGDHLGDYNMRGFSALFDFVERRETWPEDIRDDFFQEKPLTLKQRFSGFGCWFLGIITSGFLMLVGFNTVIDWIFK